jgi:hypothetical protein
MPFTKGNSGNPLGRPKGSLNSSTKEFRELLSHSIDSNKIMEMLNKIKEPTDYINAVTKLLPYYLAKVKPLDTEIQDIEPVIININLDNDCKEQ